MEIWPGWGSFHLTRRNSSFWYPKHSDQQEMSAAAWQLLSFPPSFKELSLLVITSNFKHNCVKKCLFVRLQFPSMSPEVKIRPFKEMNERQIQCMFDGIRNPSTDFAVPWNYSHNSCRTPQCKKKKSNTKERTSLLIFFFFKANFWLLLSCHVVCHVLFWNSVSRLKTLQIAGTEDQSKDLPRERNCSKRIIWP